MAQKDNSSPKKQPTSQMNLLLRCVIGAYLLYLTYSMRGNYGKPLFLVCGILFGIAGAALLVVSVKRLFQGNYDLVDAQGNLLDPDDLEEDGDEDLEEADDGAAAESTPPEPPASALEPEEDSEPETED